MLGKLDLEKKDLCKQNEQLANITMEEEVSKKENSALPQTIRGKIDYAMVLKQEGNDFVGFKYDFRILRSISFFQKIVYRDFIDKDFGEKVFQSMYVHLHTLMVFMEQILNIQLMQQV